MALRALGRIEASASPVRITNNESDPTARLPCHAILIVREDVGDANQLFIGNSAMNTTTLAGVVGILAVPTANILPSWSASIPYAPGGLNAADYYIDGTSGESCLVVVMEA